MKNKLIISRLYRTSAKAHLELKPELEEIIIGTMLGDLFAERPNMKSNARLQFKQSIKNEPYIYHLFSLFKDYCHYEPLIMSKFDSRPNKMKKYSSIKFQTLSLPCFNKYKELFYNLDGIKCIPDNLEELLTVQGLAYWIMDDGYKYNKGFYISTESFTLIENHTLAKILKNKFNLKCGVHKYTNGYRIYIFSISNKILLDLIKPYLLSHFYYKFNLL